MHFTLPSYCGNRAFSASRLSPWMIMFSLSLFSVCCPCSSKLYWPLQHPEGNFLMMVHDFIFTDPFQGWHGVFLQSKNFKLRKKGRIVVASRAFVYTNAIFALQNACWAVPNPLHSASCRCRLRVFSKRFYLYKVEFQDSCALQF